MARKRVTCLHTAAGNIPIFEEAVSGLDLALHHVVRADLLAAAEQAGGLNATIVADTEAALTEAARSTDFVLLACSTLGPIADRFEARVPVLRIDRALAEAAVAEAAATQGGRVAVLYTFPGTLSSTEALFREVAGDRAGIDMQLVEGAWDVFKSGDGQRYRTMIAAAADKVTKDGAQSVAFAQASMAIATELCRYAKPLSSPRASLIAASR